MAAPDQHRQRDPHGQSDQQALDGLPDPADEHGAGRGRRDRGGGQAGATASTSASSRSAVPPPCTGPAAGRDDTMTSNPTLDSRPDLAAAIAAVVADFRA